MLLHYKVRYGIFRGCHVSRIHVARFLTNTKFQWQFTFQGGAIALLVGLADPTAFQGMVLLGPMIMGSPETATRTKRFLAWTLARLVPRLELTAINNDDLTKNRAVVSPTIKIDLSQILPSVILKRIAATAE